MEASEKVWKFFSLRLFLATYGKLHKKLIVKKCFHCMMIHRILRHVCDEDWDIVFHYFTPFWELLFRIFVQYGKKNCVRVGVVLCSWSVYSCNCLLFYLFACCWMQSWEWNWGHLRVGLRMLMNNLPTLKYSFESVALAKGSFLSTLFHFLFYYLEKVMRMKRERERKRERKKFFFAQ